MMIHDDEDDVTPKHLLIFNLKMLSIFKSKKKIKLNISDSDQTRSIKIEKRQQNRWKVEWV